MSSGLNKPVFSSASAAAGTVKSGGAGVDASGMFQRFAQSYYKRYIATSSIKPVMHLVGGYCALHWTITQVHKHKYQTKKEFH